MQAIFNPVNSFSDYTIVHALDNSRLERESEEYKNLSLRSKIALGAYVGATAASKGLFIAAMLSMLVFQNYANESGERFSFRDSFFWEVSTVGPILEEIAYRGIMQNGMRYAQRLAQRAAQFEKTGTLKNNRVFQWITSPSARVLASGTFFALTHLPNGGPINGLLTQALRILSLPDASILHETTGNIAAPIANHVVNNLFVFLWCHKVTF